MASDRSPSRWGRSHFVALIVAILAVPLLYPVGSVAATALKKVVISDPTSGARMQVNASGAAEIQDAALRHAYQKGQTTTFSSGVASASFNVPAGERLVVTFLTLREDGGPNAPGRIEVQPNTGGDFFFRPSFAGTGAGGFEAEQVQIVADGGQPLMFTATLGDDTFAGGTFAVSLSGYLIDCTTALPCS